jgi:hypothetical protein
VAGREADPVVSGPLEAATGEVLIQTVEPAREIAIYTHRAPDHPEGYRTDYVLQLDTGVVTDAYGRRLSA